jgi:hypothetical protein
MADETETAAPAKPAKAAKGKAEDAAPAQDAPAVGGAPGEIVKVRGPEDGRWRAGIQFGPIEREVDLSTLTPEDWAEIEADPYLTIRRD